VYFTKRLFTIPEQIAGQINDSILRGELQLGDQLPSENKLAELFGVSRSTVRDALNLLRTEQIIQTRKGKFGGHFISKKASSQMIQSLKDYALSRLNLSHLSLEDFFEIRSLIEVPIAGLASLRRSEEDLASLHTLLLRLNDLSLSTPSSYLFLQTDIAFHHILALASQNPFIMETGANFTGLLEILSLQLLLSSSQQLAILEHLQVIYGAIKDKNPSQAEQGMSDYLRLP